MSQFVNAAELIRQDLELIDFDNNMIDHVEINNRRLFYKHKIYSLLRGCTVGRTVFIGHNHFDHIVPCLQAVWELGANVFVHDFKAGYVDIPEFRNFYDFVDIAIHNQWIVENFSENKHNFSIEEYQQQTQYSETEWQLDRHITADTVAVKTHSSGTTGMPKIIDFTHAMVHDLTRNLIKMFDFNERDKAFHWKTLHHASLFLNFAVPLLHVSSTHFYARAGEFEGGNYDGVLFADRALPYARLHGITRMLVPYDWLQAFDQCPPIDLMGKLSLHCIRGTTPDKVAWVIENLNPKEILDIFGCSEIGVMFVQRITKDNYLSFEPGFFTEIMPNLEYRLNRSSIDVRWVGQPWQTIEDIFEQKDTGIKFHGRNSKICRNGVEVDVYSLDKYLRQRFNTGQFQVVGDFQDNQIYLAIFDDKIPVNLDQINTEISRDLSPGHQLRNICRFKLPQVLSGMKPSCPILLYAFKNLENQDASTSS